MTPLAHFKRITLLTLFFVVIIAAIAFFVLKPHKNLGPKAVIQTAGLPTLGDPQAKNQIVAFEDLKCANCAVYNKTLFPQVKSELIDKGKAKYTVILLAFIPGSIPAANTAYCLYQQNPAYFFPFVDYVYQHQPDESTNWATVTQLMQFANAAAPKANQQKLSVCIIDGVNEMMINNNLNIARSAMGQTVSTPTLYVNGHRVTNLTMDGVKSLM